MGWSGPTHAVGGGKRTYLRSDPAAPTIMDQRMHAEGTESRGARADMQLEAAIERLLAARAARQLTGRGSGGLRWLARRRRWTR
jgi:hypothetical protein